MDNPEFEESFQSFDEDRKNQALEGYDARQRFLILLANSTTLKEHYRGPSGKNGRAGGTRYRGKIGTRFMYSTVHTGVEPDDRLPHQSSYVIDTNDDVYTPIGVAGYPAS